MADAKFTNSKTVGFISRLQDSTQINITKNSNEEVDKHVKIAQESNNPEEIEYSKKWLLCQFYSLIMKIARNKYVNKVSKNSKKIYISMQSEQYEDVEDMQSELSIRFYDFLDEYNWSTVFNYWIKLKLEWAAFNYYTKKKKQREREIQTLDEKFSSTQNNCSIKYQEQVQTLKDVTHYEKGQWHKPIDQREHAHTKQLIDQIVDIVENNFPEKKKKIFYLYFNIEDMSIVNTMSEVAEQCHNGYHSTVSNVLKEIRETIMEHLAKDDVMFKKRYKQYNEAKIAKKNKFNSTKSIVEAEVKDVIIMPNDCFNVPDNIVKYVDVDIFNDLLADHVASVIKVDLPYTVTSITITEVNVENNYYDNIFADLML